jgi:rhodanese-related sulfurtransferase
MGAGLLIIAGVVIWQVLSAQSKAQAPTQESDVRRVTLAQAKQAYDDQSAVFLDVRAADSYAEAHIPGAVNIPLAQIESRMNELPKDRWIIPYCT